MAALRERDVQLARATAAPPCHRGKWSKSATAAPAVRTARRSLPDQARELRVRRGAQLPVSNPSLSGNLTGGRSGKPQEAGRRDRQKFAGGRLPADDLQQPRRKLLE